MANTITVRTTILRQREVGRATFEDATGGAAGEDAVGASAFGSLMASALAEDFGEAVMASLAMCASEQVRAKAIHVE
jgi:hypothetical protein